MFAGITLIIKLKAEGMSKTVIYPIPHEILDMINYNSITEICEIKFHYFFSNFIPPGLLFQNVMAFPGFSCTNSVVFGGLF